MCITLVGAGCLQNFYDLIIVRIRLFQPIFQQIGCRLQMLLLIFHLICDHLPNLFSGIIQNAETLLDRILLYKGRVLKKNTCDQKNQNCRHFDIKIFFLMQSFFMIILFHMRLQFIVISCANSAHDPIRCCQSYPYVDSSALIIF